MSTLALLFNSASLITISSALNQLTDVVFQHTTTEDFKDINKTIGWMQYASCVEGWHDPLVESPLIFPNGWEEQDMIDVSRYAITVKILPSTDTPGNEDTEYAVKADICSNPIYALNNGYELSFTLDESTSLITGYSDLDNWIGSTNAKGRLTNSCFAATVNIGANSRLISNGYFYQGCGNYYGLHIVADEKMCMFEYNDNIGVSISIWVGFDINKVKFCEFDSSGAYGLSTTQDPTVSPTTFPTTFPSEGPTVHPTAFPSEDTSSTIDANIVSSEPTVKQLFVRIPTANPTVENSYSLIETIYDTSRNAIKETDNKSFWNVGTMSGAIVLLCLIVIIVALLCRCMYQSHKHRDDIELVDDMKARNPSDVAGISGKNQDVATNNVNTADNESDESMESMYVNNKLPTTKN